MRVMARIRMRRRVSSPPIIVAVGLAACGGDRGGPREAMPIADLRADANRDGEVRFDDSDENKTDWNKSTGAIFLANIDDDSKRCLPSLNDLTIALCNDAQDEIVNGDDDARDLARLKTRPSQEPPDAVGHVTIATESAKDMIRIFRKSGPGVSDFELLGEEAALHREQLEAGVELGIEAKDIVRDPAKWDGYVDIRLTVSSKAKGDSTDTVRLRVAPVLTFHHLLPAERIWVPQTITDARREMHDDLTESCISAGLGAPQPLDVVDQWAQDFFEPGYMSMPGPNGSQHVVRVNYRSANVTDPEKPRAPLRAAGRIVFALRGRDVAGVQQFDIEHAPEMDGLNSLGNLETVPPYEKDGVSFPFGRVLRGRTKSFYPDRAFSRMVEAQGQQPPIDIDTSWLHVGHVDETLTFVKAPTRRGWMLLANDPTLAKKMLEDAVANGAADVPMFVGRTAVEDASKSAEITIERVLADPEVMQASAEAAAEIDLQLAILKREIGLSDDEIVRVPFLHDIHAYRSVAYQPAMVNGLYVSDTRFAAPDPHGPVIEGKDIFKAALAEPLARIGITVDWIEDWDAYHRSYGEVHCGSNATRKIPEARWWESGR